MAAHLSGVSCPFPCRVPLCHSVCSNNITGDAANHLATVVLEHAAMTDFCGIPLASLRENSITELNLYNKGVGVPGAIVLSKLLPSAAALTSLKCAPARVFGFVSAPIDTHGLPPSPRPAPRSLGDNHLTNYLKDMSGLLKFVKILPETKIESLRCAAAPCSGFCVNAP